MRVSDCSHFWVVNKETKVSECCYCLYTRPSTEEELRENQHAQKDGRTCYSCGKDTVARNIRKIGGIRAMSLCPTCKKVSI